MEPLDEQADERDHAIHPENDADQDPVQDADEQFRAAGIRFKRLELLLCVSVFGHTISKVRCMRVCVILLVETLTGYGF